MSVDIFFTSETIRLIKSFKSHVYYDYFRDEIITYIAPPEAFETPIGDYNLVYLGEL